MTTLWRPLSAVLAAVESSGVRPRSNPESPLALPVERRYHRAMKSMRQLTAIIEREDDVYVALCPELDIASQGQTVEAARNNLIEALELFFESADPTEIARRLHSEVFVTRVEVAVG
jgi:predicted RNase H-like HicB family nuclease